jgi:hypothetical protein
MTGKALALALLLAQGQPVPQPFPRPGAAAPPAPGQPAPPSRPQPAQPTPAPAGAPPASSSSSVPTEATLGVAIYPTAQYLTSFDAGRGQRFYLFGTTGTFVDVVTYYRTILKQRGDLVFDVPATHEFDIGKFNEDTMAFPPSVTIKDFQSAVSQGFPNPKPGGQPARFPTVIQVVPVPSGATR